MAAGRVVPNPAKKAEVRNVKTYKALRIQTIGHDKRQPGELVPEAAMWLRVDSHVHTGYLEEVTIPVDEYVVAVRQYCPNLAEDLASRVKIDVGLLMGEQ